MANTDSKIQNKNSLTQCLIQEHREVKVIVYMQVQQSVDITLSIPRGLPVNSVF